MVQPSQAIRSRLRPLGLGEEEFELTALGLGVQVWASRPIPVGASMLKRGCLK